MAASSTEDPRVNPRLGSPAEARGGAALAGLFVALGEGIVGREERVVLLVTGSGLKDVAAAARRVALPDPIPPTIDAVEP